METVLLSTKRTIVKALNKALKKNYNLHVIGILDNLFYAKRYDKKYFSIGTELYTKKELYNLIIKNKYVFIKFN